MDIHHVSYCDIASVLLHNGRTTGIQIPNGIGDFTTHTWVGYEPGEPDPGGAWEPTGMTVTMRRDCWLAAYDCEWSKGAELPRGRYEIMQWAPPQVLRYAGLWLKPDLAEERPPAGWTARDHEGAWELELSTGALARKWNSWATIEVRPGGRVECKGPEGTKMLRGEEGATMCHSVKTEGDGTVALRQWSR